MITLSEELQNGLKGSYYGPNWIEVMLKDTLDGIDASIAFRQPPGDVHCIAGIVCHLITWRQGLINAMQNNKSWSVNQETSFDTSKYGAEDTDGWNNIKAALEDTQQQLTGLLSQQDENSLQQQVPQREYSFEYFINGTIQHDMYHLGQIVILKKQVL